MASENDEQERFNPQALGLKCGLEIHQQLGNATTKNRKLFCDCPAEIVERKPDVVFTRRLRALAGETGDIDIAAAAEQAKGKQYTYHAFNDDTCLVETDDEPPHPVNQEAMATGVMVAKAFGSMILPRVQFMRKTVVDGSAVSGFQRTGLLALGGIVPDVSPQVRIQTLCVEEDAAKIVERKAEEDIYDLSRLGIPLLEIATEPDITSPAQAQEVAAQIGMVLRSSRRVKRGLGTIRQDVNISIAGGERIEIKGCQDLRLLQTYVEYEALRQKGLLELKDLLLDLLHGRRPEIGAPIDVTPRFADSQRPFIKDAIAKKHARAVAIIVPSFKGIFKRELCPDHRVGSELADLARTAGFGGLIHSDEDLSHYGLSPDGIHALLNDIKDAGMTEADGFAILIGADGRARRVYDTLIIPRIRQFLLGVPKEVRKANPDGTTSFMRPIPGAARMYPETDIPLVAVDAASVAAPKLLSEQAKELAARARISDDQARQVVREGLPLDEWLDRYPSIDATFLATALLTFGKEIEARYKKSVDHIPLLEPLLDAVERKRIPRSAAFEILVEIAEGKTAPDKVDFGKYAQMPDEALRAIVREEIKKGPSLPVNGVMGNVMARVRGKADGKRVLELIVEERRLLL